MALPQKYRFNIHKDFLNLKKNGKMINSESFGFLFIGSDNLRVVTTKNGNRFNYIVSTKISKKAVVRNLIRRRLSEIVRELLLSKNINGVFLCKKAIIGKTYKELRDEVERLVGKI